MQRMELTLEQKMEGILAPRLERESEMHIARSNVVNTVYEYTMQLLDQDHPIVRVTDRIALVRYLIGTLAQDLDQLISRNNHQKTFERAISDLVFNNIQRVRSRMDAVHPLVATNESAFAMLKVLENSRFIGNHYKIAAATPNAVLRPLVKSDVDAVRELYEVYRLRMYDILRMVKKQQVTGMRTFLSPFESHEGPTMLTMLPKSAVHPDFHVTANREGAMREETMYGTGLWTPDGKDLLGVSVHTVAPLHPKVRDPYTIAQNELWEKGVSGGRMTYPMAGDEAAMFLKALEGGKHAKLFLVIGREEGAAARVLSADILRLFEEGIVDDSYSFFTYAMHALRFYFEDEQLFRDLPGQNVGSSIFLQKFGYMDLGVTDENTNPDAPAEFFELSRGAAIRVHAAWKHFLANGLRHRACAESVRDAFTSILSN